MAMEKGKQRIEPASRETDPRDLETSAAVSGDNDIDRIQTQPDDEAKKETDEAYINGSTGGNKTSSANRETKESGTH